MKDFHGKGFRVMSPAEYESASLGQWADGSLVAGDPMEAGKKWLWENGADAKSWAKFLKDNGEVRNIIAEVPTFEPLVGYPTYAHAPQGSAIHVPISDLGPAIAIDE